MTVRVYHARWVLPITAPPIPHGAVAVAGGRIAWVGPSADAPPGLALDLGHAVVMPGLVNVHAHLELTAMRGFLEDLAFRPWILRLTKAREAVMSEARRCAAARAGIAEGLLAGITTFGDVSDSGASLVALQEMGARGIMYQEVFGPDPAQCAAALSTLRDQVAAARLRASARVAVGVSPHAPYTVSDELLRATAAYARAEGLPLTVHVAESAAEDELVTKGSGPFADAWRARGIAVTARAATPIELLQATGVLDARPLLVHAVRARPSDLRLMHATGSRLAHCPASNAKLGHGVAPLAEALDLGIPTGLGSDSVASSNRMDLLDDARLAILQQRSRTGRPDAPGAATMLRLATLGGATALGMEAVIGSLDAGKAADLVAFPLDRLRDAPDHAPEETLVFGAGGRRASLVMVDGVELVRGGALGRDIGDDLAILGAIAHDLRSLSGPF